MIITRKSKAGTRRLPACGAIAANGIDRRVGEQITAARLQAGLSKIDLATRSGVGTSMLTKIESGTARPSGQELVRISQAVGVSLSNLFQADRHSAAGIQA